MFIVGFYYCIFILFKFYIQQLYIFHYRYNHCNQKYCFLGKSVTINLKPNQAETVSNYSFKYSSVLHHNTVEIGSVILTTKSYSQFKRWDHCFIKFRSKRTTKNARILKSFSFTNDKSTLVNIFQIQNSLIDNFQERNWIGQFPSFKLLEYQIP